MQIIASIEDTTCILRSQLPFMSYDLGLNFLQMYASTKYNSACAVEDLVCVEGSPRSEHWILCVNASNVELVELDANSWASGFMSASLVLICEYIIMP